jgi:hypothetical protein
MDNSKKVKNQNINYEEDIQQNYQNIKQENLS